MSRLDGTIPAGLFGEALLSGWCGPVRAYGVEAVILRRDEPNMHGEWVLAPVTEWEAVWTGCEELSRSVKTNEISLDLTREECRARLCRVLARLAGRSFHAWHLLPKAEGGRLSNEYAAASPALLAAHALRVAAGKGGVCALGPYRTAYGRRDVALRVRERLGDSYEPPAFPVRVREDGSWIVDCFTSPNEVEGTEGGTTHADAAALDVGYALFGADGALYLPEVP